MEKIIESYLKKNRDNIIDDVVNFVKIPSVMARGEDGFPYGRESARALDFCIELCEEKGFSTKNFEHYCAEAGIGEDRGGKKIVLASHVDVVPPDEDGIYGAFSGAVANGYIIGRGVVDDKAPLIATIYALNFFKENKIALNNNFTLLFGANEEMGMDDIEYYLSKNPQPDLAIAVDDDFPVVNGEKGQILFSLKGKKSKNIKEILSKRHLQQSVPYECYATVLKNDISSLYSEKKSQLGNPISDLILNLFKGNISIFENEKQTGAICDLVYDNWGSKVGLSFEDEKSGKLIIKPIAIYNSPEDFITVDFDVRYPVFDTCERVLKIIEDVAERGEFTLNIKKNNPGYYVPEENDIVKLLTEVYNKNSNANESPYVMTGCTYSRKFKTACGFGAGNPHEVKPFPKGHGGSHGPDEAHNIDVLIHAVKIYILGIKALDDYYSKKA